MPFSSLGWKFFIAEVIGTSEKPGAEGGEERGIYKAKASLPFFSLIWETKGRYLLNILQVPDTLPGLLLAYFPEPRTVPGVQSFVE